MHFISGIADQWLGLCRKPPAVHALQTGICIPTEPACEGQSDGGGGGLGTIRRGVGAALSGMRTLNRNRQLLWFALLAGLVLAGNIICQGALWYIDWRIGGFVGQVLGFFVEFATLFGFVFLLAGLILSISSEKEGHASFFEGLTGAKKYTTAIIAWSFVLALAGMLLFSIYFYGGVFNNINGFLLNPLLQFPFTLNLNPSTFAEFPDYGGRSFLFWTYPYGFEDALTFSAINLLLIILTAFVMPLIVLEQKTLKEAVVGSFALMKKTWAEIVTCAVLLGIIVSGVYLTYLLIQAAHGMVTPPELLYAIPIGPWIALGVLYYLALFSIAFVMATVGSIAVLDLYHSAKTGQITGPEPHS